MCIYSCMCVICDVITDKTIISEILGVKILEIEIRFLF